MRLALRITLASIVVTAAFAVCSSGGGVTAPALVRFVALNYSSGAEALFDEAGTAVVIVKVDGTVEDVTIKDAAGVPLEEAIVKATRKWEFIPASKDGHAVACQIFISFSFHSQSGELTVDLGHYTGE